MEEIGIAEVARRVGVHRSVALRWAQAGRIGYRRADGTWWATVAETDAMSNAHALVGRRKRA